MAFLHGVLVCVVCTDNIANSENFAYFWSADKQSPYTSFYKRLYNLNDNITSDFSSFNDGSSIRCIKDTANMISYMPVLTTIPVSNITNTSAHWAAM